MTAEAAKEKARRLPDDELLSWENLGAQPPGRAFLDSLGELLAHPRRFFRKMAVSGGLHEPLAFLSLVMAAVLLLAFPAALAYLGLRAPDPTLVRPEEYGTATLPARLTGLLAVLLPLVLVAGSAAMVLLGTLFHIAGRLFGSRNWEGSVSIWLYSFSAALVPFVLALAAVFVVSLMGYLVGIPWPGSRGVMWGFARWTSVVLFSAATLAAVALVLLTGIVGCTQAFDLDSTRGSAAAVSGLLLVTAVVGICAWGFASRGAVTGLVLLAICILVAAGLTAVSTVRSRRVEGSV